MMLTLLAAAILKPASDTTYSEHIRPIIANRCAPCHYEGGAGAFPLLTYEQVARRAQLVRYVSLIKYMPPVDANSPLDSLTEHSELTDSELIDIQLWVSGGMPKGEDTEPIQYKPNAPEPSLKIPVTGYKIQREGGTYTKELQLTIPKKTFIRGFTIYPQYPTGIRQVILARAPKRGESPTFTPTGIRTERLIGAWSNGYNHLELKNSTYEFEAGETIIARVLYQPSGKIEDGGFTVGFYESLPSPNKPKWITLGKKNFVLEPSEALIELQDSKVLNEKYTLTAMLPELKNYARNFRLYRTTPATSEREYLGGVYTWDPQWPGAFNFKKGIPLEANTTLFAITSYDNSGHAFGDSRVTPKPVPFGGGEDQELNWTHILLEPRP